jgi:hypothetical protein
MINRRVPFKVSRSIRWLRKPSSFPARVLVALLLVVGGLFSFLPVLGLWMLPLGLLFIAQDMPLLQQPLVNALAWGEAKWDRLRTAWRQMRRSQHVDDSHSDSTLQQESRQRKQIEQNIERTKETIMSDYRDKRGGAYDRGNVLANPQPAGAEQDATPKGSVGCGRAGRSDAETK